MPDNKEIRTSNISENKMFKTIVSLSKTNDKLNLTIERLEETIADLKKVIADQQAQLKAKDEQTVQLIEQLRAMTAIIYGQRSEKQSRKSRKKSDKDDSDSGPASGSGSGSSDPQSADKSGKKANTHRALPKKKKERKPKPSVEEFIAQYHPEVHTIYCDLSEEEKICQACGSPLQRMGEKFSRYEFEITMPEVVVNKYITYTYSCPACKKRAADPNCSDTEIQCTPVSAKAPLSLLPGSWVSSKLMSFVIGLKALFQIPATRMINILREMGSMSVSTGTLSTWLIRTAQIYFRPLYARLKSLLLQRSHLQADETTLQVINESCTRRKRKSYLWQYRTADSDCLPIVLFEYCQGRSGEYAARFLHGFKGTLMVDGYAGYNKVDDTILAYCWVHARRYFIEASICSSVSQVQSVAEKAIESIDTIFSLERDLEEEDLALQDRVRWRLDHVQPEVNRLFDWIKSLDPSRLYSEKLRRAIQYLLNHEKGLRVFLHDPEVPTHNNRAEAAFVPVARGRHNWLFAYSEEGAEALAILFSMTQTAKMNGLNVFRYLELVMNTFRDWRDRTIPDHIIDRVLPWNQEVRDLCPNLG